jgi:hypothetical protein
MKTLTDAQEARQQADDTGIEFVRQLNVLMDAVGIHRDADAVTELDKVFAQLRADEYEAGWAAGRAMHPANRKDHEVAMDYVSRMTSREVGK